MSHFRGVRSSKFRHVFGTGARREQCYEGIRISSSAHDSQFCAVNPKFLAVILEVAGGGAFQAIPLKWVGRLDYQLGRIGGHNGPVTDLKWNPFNDNVIASSSDDGTVKLWYIPDDGVKTSLNQWLSELVGHSRRVAYIEWHPTAENVLASAGFDHRIFIWNVSSADCLVDIDCHPDTIYSLSFSRLGHLLATTCKDKLLRVIDARTGEVLQDTLCHEGNKASKVAFVADDRIVTTGFSRNSSRQFALWDQDDLSQPLVLQEVDFSSGVLFPIFDYDTGMLYVAGKGDGNIRFYELTKEEPFVHYLSEFRSIQPQRGLGLMPKRGLNVAACEIFRFYKLHATQQLVEPLSFTVPRKAETFQCDLYPPTAGPTPAVTADEWFCGIDKEPVLISLKAGFVPITNKLVQVRKSMDAAKPLLITADRNNERKFQFLSQVTRADYREVTQREDYEILAKHEQLHQKLHQHKDLDAQRNSVASDDRSASPPSSPLPLSEPVVVDATATRMSVSSADELSHRVSHSSRPPAPPSSRSNPPSARVSPRSHLPRHPHEAAIPESSTMLLRCQSQEPSETSRSEGSQQDTRKSLDLTGVDVSVGLADTQRSPPLLRRQLEYSQLPRMTRPQPVKVSESGVAKVVTKPGRISAGPVVTKEQTAHVRPFVVREKPPMSPPTGDGVSKKDTEVQQLYATQCKQVRSLLEEAETKDRRIRQLETDIAQLMNRVERMEKDAHVTVDEIASLRHEITWKDSRIEELQRQLYQLHEH